MAAGTGIPPSTTWTWLNSSSPGWSYYHLYVLKKQLMTQFAVSSFVGYVMVTGNRTPDNIYFSLTTGHLLQLHFSPSYSTSGLLECKETVPFRLTPNIVSFLSPLGMRGVWNAVMTASAVCLTEMKTHIENHLKLYLWDDVMSYQVSTSTTESHLKEQIKGKVAANLATIMQRISSFSQTSSHQPQLVTVHKKVNELIEMAESPEHLSQMDPTWHPWF